MEATRQLAEFVASTTFDRLPPEVVRECKRAVLNYLGVAVGACRHEAARILIEATRESGGHPQATVLGAGLRTSALQAALINGFTSHVFDYDDTDMETIIHPTGPVLSAVLPLAEWKGVDGAGLLAALAAGMEVELRAGAAVYPTHYDVGWHISGTVGTFGAAAGAGWLLGLDSERLASALGLAGTQAAGLRESFGYMAKAFHIGKAASNGLQSALLAEKGFTGSPRILEAKRGFCSVAAAEHDLSKAVRGLGDEYYLLRNCLKPYACGVVQHPIIDGVRRLRARHGLRPEEVAEIEVRANRLVPELTGKRHPATALEGKFSVYFSAAIALIEGNAGESQFTDEKVRRSDVVAVMDRIRVVVEPSVTESQAEVVIRTGDGRELMERVEAATGTPGNPLSDDDLVAKFMDLVDPILRREKAEGLVGLAWRLEEVDDLGGLISLAVA